MGKTAKLDKLWACLLTRLTILAGVACPPYLSLDSLGGERWFSPSSPWRDLLSSPSLLLLTLGMTGDWTWHGEAIPLICCTSEGAGGCLFTYSDSPAGTNPPCLSCSWRMAEPYKTEDRNGVFPSYYWRPEKYMAWDTELLSGLTSNQIGRDKTKATAKYIQYVTVIRSRSNLWIGPVRHPSWWLLRHFSSWGACDNSQLLKGNFTAELVFSFPCHLLDNFIFSSFSGEELLLLKGVFLRKE